MKKARHYFWLFSNLYGYLFGWPFLAPLHRLQLNLSLHALGYDNARFTGEEWFIKHVLSHEDTKVCIDVGANVGAYTRMLVRHLDCRVYAIEPSSSSFEALQKNIGGDKRVRPLRFAAGDQNGSAILFSRAALSEKATLTPSPQEVSAIQESVEVRTLDSVVKEQSVDRVDFIKIDTEGHEEEVFRGMQETLKHLRPKFIQFEFNHVHLYRGVTLYRLAQLLEGYDFYRLLPHGMAKIDPQAHVSNIFMFSNIVARRKS